MNEYCLTIKTVNDSEYRTYINNASNETDALHRLLLLNHDDWIEINGRRGRAQFVKVDKIESIIVSRIKQSVNEDDRPKVVMG